MYGRYGYRFCVERGDLKVCFSKEGDFIRYFRSLGDTTVERIIASESGTVYINPVEPLNLPDEVTRYLEIRFEPILIEPEAVRQIYLTFPIEIGVFLGKSDAIQLIDVFSRMPQKYSLYGPTDTGVITRYYWSAVYLHRPSPDPCYEGVLELTMNNATKGWVEVSRVVFENYGMKIYFDQDLVSMKGNMQIVKHTIAETSIINQPIRQGMQKSLELYYARGIPGVERAIYYIMEEGVS